MGPRFHLSDRWLLALIAFCISVTFSYTVLRVMQALIYPEPDPRLVVWSTRVAMFWRLGVSLYLAGFAALGVLLMARHAHWRERLPRYFVRGAGATLAVLLVQVVVWP